MPGTTPVYGFPYPEPTDLVADYPALGQDLAEDIEAALPGIPGLQLISPTSIANSGGTASSTSGTTTFTSVNSISLNGVWTATYQNYRVVIDVVNSAGVQFRYRYRLAGTDNSGTNYVTQTIRGEGSSALANDATYNYANVVEGTGVTTWYAYMDIFNPALAVNTAAIGVSRYNAPGMGMTGVIHTVATAYDGITYYPSSGTMTGKVRVYGYKGA